MRALAITGIEMAPGDTTLRADVGRYALQRHDGDCAGILADLGLLGVDDVHDDATLEHFCHAALDPRRTDRGRLIAHCCVV